MVEKAVIVNGGNDDELILGFMELTQRRPIVVDMEIMLVF